MAADINSTALSILPSVNTETAAPRNAAAASPRASTAQHASFAEELSRGTPDQRPTDDGRTPPAKDKGVGSGTKSAGPSTAGTRSGARPSAAKAAPGDSSSAAAADGTQKAAEQSPVVALLTGHLERLNPSQLPALITGNAFVADAMAQEDVVDFMAQPAPLADLVQKLGLPPAVLTQMQNAGIDISQPMAPKDLCKALGLDATQITAELQQLKSNILLEGVAPYIRRAEALAKQNSGKNAVSLPLDGLGRGTPGDPQTVGAPTLPAKSGLAAGAGPQINGAIPPQAFAAAALSGLNNLQLAPQAQPAQDASPAPGSGSALGPSGLGGTLAAALRAAPPGTQVIVTRTIEFGPGTDGGDDGFTELEPLDSSDTALLLALASAERNAAGETDAATADGQAAAGNRDLATTAARLAGANAPSSHKATFDSFALMGDRLRGDDVLLTRAHGDLLDDSGAAAPVRSDALSDDALSRWVASARINRGEASNLPAQRPGGMFNHDLGFAKGSPGGQDGAFILQQGIVTPAANGLPQPGSFADFHQAKGVDLAVPGHSLLSIGLPGALFIPDGASTPLAARTPGAAPSSAFQDAGLPFNLTSSLNAQGTANHGFGQASDDQSGDQPGRDAQGSPNQRFATVRTPLARPGEAGTTNAPANNAFMVGAPAADVGLSPQQRVDMVQKVMHHASMLAKEGGGSMRLDLGSPELGPLEMAINVNKDQLDLRVMTGSDRVRDAMMADLGHLKNALSVQNVRLGNVDVGVGGRQPQQNQQQNPQNQPNAFNNAFANGGGLAGGRGFGGSDGRQPGSGSGARPQGVDEAVAASLARAGRARMPVSGAPAQPQAAALNGFGRIAVRA